jgi:VWFA-related protein
VKVSKDHRQKLEPKLSCSRTSGRSSLFVAFSFFCFLGVAGANSGLAAQQSTAAPAPVYTVRADARLVVEDVLVTDARGNPVKGLPQSAFHVADDAKPQAIRNFEESAGGATATAAPGPAAGEFGNSNMLGGDGPIAVLLLDPIGAEIPDQMYLRLQVLRTLDRLPPATQIAIFRTSAHGVPLLVQSLTRDRKLLQAAISNSIPSFSTPSSSAFSNGLQQIDGISAYLGQIPGRKSLLWFASTFPLSETPGGPAQEHHVAYDQELEAVKNAYRELEKARIAVFPIDLRGVVNVNLSLAARPSTSGPPVGSDNKPIIGEVGALPGGDVAQRSSWNAMDSIAAATGGRAYYSNNDLDSVTRQALNVGSHAYTLTYSPHPYAADGSWHKVRVTVDGGYTVSYRQGYYAQEAHPVTLDQATAAKEADGATALAEDANRQRPIVFLAKLESAEPGAKKPSHFVIRYAVTAQDVRFEPGEGGSEEATLKVAALAYNGDGTVLSDAVDTVHTHYDAKQMSLASRIGVPMLQQIAIAHGAKYLLLSVVDMQTGRTGTVQLTVATARANSTEAAQ